MGHGNIPGDLVIGAEREPDEFGAHGIQRCGLGVEGEARHALEKRHQLRQLVVVGDEPVLAAVDAGHLTAELAQQTAELELGEEIACPVLVGRPDQGELIEGDLDRGVVADGGEVAREEGLLTVAFELGLGAGRCHLVDVGVDLVEALPFGQERLGALFSDALDTGDVVRRVAPDPEGVGDELGWAAEFLLDLRKRDPAVLHGVEEGDVVGDELHEVLVRGDENDVEFVFVTAGEGAHDIVGLEVVDAEEGHVEGLGDA